MSLREQFELWWNTERMATAFYSHKQVAEEAYQAGHAVNADLLGACELVQQWWICYGMHRFRDEPAAILKVHEAIKKARAE